MPFIENNWILIVVLLVSGGMLLWPLIQRRTSPMKEIGNLEVTHLINQQNAVLLDVREPSAFEGGKLPNALHIPLSQLQSRIGELAKLTGRPVVAYCMRGQRSRGAGAVLAKAGFAGIYTLQGGVLAWKGAGLPLDPC
jgi:rhodanese-related sulfurtransferase